MSNAEHKKKIAGKWTGEVIEAEGQHDTYPIVMELTWIDSTGKHYTVEGSGYAEHRDYGKIPMLFSGRFRLETQFIQLDYRNEDPGIIHFGTCIMELSKEANALEGQFVGCSPVDDVELISGTLTFTKD